MDADVVGSGHCRTDTKGLDIHPVLSGHPQRAFNEGVLVDHRRQENPSGDRAPLGWDVNDADPVARACVALMSDWFPMTTGEMLHVDGGVHAMGA